MLRECPAASHHRTFTRTVPFLETSLSSTLCLVDTYLSLQFQLNDHSLRKDLNIPPITHPQLILLSRSDFGCNFTCLYVVLNR